MPVRIFKPYIGVGQVYAKAYGVAGPMPEVGGVSELKLTINEDIKKQRSFNRTGGGNRATVNQIKEVMFEAKLQDLNAVNIARGVFGQNSEVALGTIVGEPHKAYKGGLIRLAHPAPTSVVVKIGAVTVVAGTNYEVRPEGIYILDLAATIVDGDDVLIDYAHTGYDVIQALVTSAPTLEMSFGGMNEADNSSPLIVDVFRVKMNATGGFGLITSDFAEFDQKGEVLEDPTKIGVGISKFFKVYSGK